jgi:plastocyanin
MGKLTPRVYCYFSIIGTVLLTLTLIGSTFGVHNSVFATTGNIVPEGRPDINASIVYDTHTMVLGNNIKNLVMLIPNEAHESTNQPKNQYPLANQPYLPQNAVINVGTAVTWFNGDVDHDHKVTVTVSDESDESTNAGFESGDFIYNTASKPIKFNNTGTFNFFEADVNSDDPSFVMNGTISVINQANTLNGGANATTVTTNTDTVGTYMVPAQDLEQYISTLTSKGFTIDSTHTFQDLRGGQKGTGPKQTLIVWTTSGMNLDQIISALEEITLTLPYS